MGLKNNEISARRYMEHHSYPEEVLNYIHVLVPNDRKGYILDVSDKVSLKEFYETLQIKFYCNVLLTVVFGTFIGKSFQQKFLFQ